MSNCIIWVGLDVYKETVLRPVPHRQMVFTVPKNKAHLTLWSGGAAAPR